ncbi:ATPase family protein associated with various cellular activities (AAA) [Oceanihabitans sediminis]|uniref:AAA family ATPase n=1 Tax=Oceanihabitans sediminis TaxID=1812012 RepID=A0A368P8H5_9FLAO|nr:ATP-binding protein [Oceanihabitans sediminis]RBP32116.1 ATPase family protein associated with various cellular activities (AAA) [Oceanihabitans sediminis]RCU58766.1 AAA family ATPase [Oceanihabitans sediminis]
MAYHDTTLRTKHKTLTLEELHLSEEVRNSIHQLIEEFTYLEALKKYDIPVDNKILLHGKTGCGKTATVHAIGKALNKEVITLNLGGFVSSKLGETGKNITELFKKTSYNNAILFIDEFDFIGKLRDYDNKDSGEMQRLVNTIIQQIDNMSDTALLIGATNHLEVIDSALLRRFQIKLKYKLPTSEQLDNYYDSLLAKFPKEINSIKRAYDLSYAEAKDIALQQIKANVIQIEKRNKA